MTRAEYRHRRAIWSAANDDRAGDLKRPPRPFFMSRLWRFDLPFAAIWLAGWGAYLLARFM